MFDGSKKALISFYFGLYELEAMFLDGNGGLSKFCCQAGYGPCWDLVSIELFLT